MQFTSTLTDVTEVDVAIQPFGQQQLGVLTNNPFAFGARQGYRTDPDSGFIYVRNRWLDPSTGRWLSRDPVEGEHPYGYARNNPMLYSDPSGMQAGPQAGGTLRVPSPHFDWMGHLSQREAVAVLQELKRLQPQLPPSLRLPNNVRFDTAGPDGNQLLTTDLRIYQRLDGYLANLRAYRPLDDFQGMLANTAHEVGLSRLLGGQYPISAYGHDSWDVIMDSPSALAKGRQINALIGPYMDLIKLSANRNGIPHWLLASVLTAEIAATSFKDIIEDLVPGVISGMAGREVSIGMGQMQANRAVQHGLVDIAESDIRALQHSIPFVPVYSHNQAAISIARSRLLQPKIAIEAAARELAFEIAAIKSLPNGSLFRRYALARTSTVLQRTHRVIPTKQGYIPLFGRFDLTTHDIPGFSGVSDRYTVAETGEEFLVFVAVMAYNSPDIVRATRVQSDPWTQAYRQAALAASAYKVMKASDLLDR